MASRCGPEATWWIPLRRRQSAARRRSPICATNNRMRLRWWCRIAPRFSAGATMPTSFAEDAGFLRGDLIVEINHTAVRSEAQYNQVLGNLKPGQDVVFKVMRRSETDNLLTIYLAGVIPTP